MYYVCANVKNIILAGDFNAVTRARDKVGSSVRKLKKYESEWNQFIKNLNLIECNCNKVMSAEERMTWSNGTVSSKIDELIKSDHKAVFASFDFETSLNNSIENEIKPYSNNFLLNSDILDFYLDKKELKNSLVLLKFKRDVTERDYNKFMQTWKRC